MKQKNEVQAALDTAYFPNENEKYMLQQKILRGIESGEREQKRKFPFSQLLSFIVLTAMAVSMFLFAGFQSGLVKHDSGSTKERAKGEAKVSYQFQIINSSVKLVYFKWNDQNVLEYNITLKDNSEKPYNWSRDNHKEIHFDIHARKDLVNFMVDNMSGPEFTMSNSNIRSLNGETRPPFNGGMWTYRMQYEIKKGEDPKTTLKRAQDADLIIQIGGHLVQKTDLLTLKSTSLNTPVLTRKQRSERVKLREGFTINRSRDFITQFLGKNYTEMTSASGKETIWRYDIGAVNGYRFNPSPYKADLNGLKKDHLKKQMYFTIDNKVRNVKSITVYYLNKNDHKVHRYRLNSKGEDDVAMENKKEE